MKVEEMIMEFGELQKRKMNWVFITLRKDPTVTQSRLDLETGFRTHQRLQSRPLEEPTTSAEADLIEETGVEEGLIGDISEATIGEPENPIQEEEDLLRALETIIPIHLPMTIEIHNARQDPTISEEQQEEDSTDPLQSSSWMPLGNPST